MVYFRKDGSLDTTLIAFVYPPIAEIQKLCNCCLDLDLQFQKKRDGGVKVYLAEEKKDELSIRNFLLPEKILEFDKTPKVFIEAVEHVDFIKEKKQFVRIFSNINGDPFMSFYNPITPQKNGGHAYFTFWEGYELILFFEKGAQNIQIVKLDRLTISPTHFHLSENVVYESPFIGEMPREFRKLKRAIQSLKDKFECKDCTHAHFKKYRPD